ncbi:hypothetical protein D3C81_2120990 [compost metagenome]
MYTPAVGRHAAGDQVEQRALAGAIGPDDAQRLTRRQGQAEIVGHLHRAVALVHLLQYEELLHVSLPL